MTLLIQLDRNSRLDSIRSHPHAASSSLLDFARRYQIEMQHPHYAEGQSRTLVYQHLYIAVSRRQTPSKVRRRTEFFLTPFHIYLSP